MKLSHTFLGGLAAVWAEFCPDKECYFELRLQWRLTMSCMNPADKFWYPVTFDDGGTTIHKYESALYPQKGTYKDDEGVPQFKPWLYQDHTFDESRCVYGDGSRTGIVTINDQHPGPVLEVNKDALVHVTVVNELLGGTAAYIHFHGFKFGGGYMWYDGVAGLTQCPIVSGQKFTYSFIASEVGLRWYHGHGSGLKLDGLYGPIIVYETNPRQHEPNVLMINDHFSEITHGTAAGPILASSVYTHAGTGELDNNLNTRWFMEDGTSTTPSTFDSLLINGRQATMDNQIPMSAYDMRENKSLHLVCSSAETGIEVEVANHEIRLLELDGYPVNPTVARRLYLGPGETAKIELNVLDTNNVEMEMNVLLKANAAGSYRGWVDKETKQRSESPTAYAILKLTDDDDWC